MKNKIINLIGKVLTVVGIFVCIGSVGAFENEAITFLQMVIQILLGIAGGFIGLICFASSEEVEYEY